MPTPGKNYEGQKGYPTPDSVPDTIACRVFRVPDNDAWLGVLMAAIETTLDEWRWYNWGSISIADTVDAWNEIILASYAESLVGTCPTNIVEAPYWDTASDADDNADFSDQPWYGLLEVS